MVELICHLVYERSFAKVRTFPFKLEPTKYTHLSDTCSVCCSANYYLFSI